MPAQAVAAHVSDQESRRAAAFSEPRARNHYLAAHAALRSVLAGLAATSPQDLVFATGDFGKPFLAQHKALRFNLSHSENWALIGVSEAANGQPALELGVDVEVWRELPDASDMLAHIGSAAEIAGLESSPADGPADSPADNAAKRHASQSLLNLWTRKEACMKAVGCGLQWDPRSIEVGHTLQKKTLEAWPQAPQAPQRRLCVESLNLSRHGLSAAVAQLQAD